MIDMMNLIKQTLNQEKTFTENGALAYRTSGHELLDLNFQVSGLRNKGNSEIKKMFTRAFFENPDLAVRWLFYLRDVRGGMGERRSFRIMMEVLAEVRPEETKRLLPLISEYGRWDDLVYLSRFKQLEEACFDIIQKQLKQDAENYLNHKPISLLAKWLPSEKPKRVEDKVFVSRFLAKYEVTRSNYRKSLKTLRNALKVVECQMTSGRWSDIDYNIVPSRANLIYNAAFLKHDEERRREFLESLKKGDKNAKINAGALFPSDIVHNYRGKPGYDETLEQLWKNLPNTETQGDVIVVADGSGSMNWHFLAGTHIYPLDISNALAIYFAEKMKGPYANRYITFSDRPQYVNLSIAKSLYDKIHIAYQYNDCSNTNIVRTFDLILNTAINNQLDQSDIPSTVLVISDMEFDQCGYHVPFDLIKKEWKAAGYQMPKLVFWNVCGRSGGIPIQQNQAGVVLLSGFSPAVYKMAMNNETDPYQALIHVVMDSRYDAVTTAWNG